MGMFDTIYCRRPLPDGRQTSESFQSKSLCNCLSVFEITADGRLREIELNDQGQPVAEKTHDTGFHRLMRFYTHADHGFEEYEAKFTDGALVKACSRITLRRAWHARKNGYLTMTPRERYELVQAG